MEDPVKLVISAILADLEGSMDRSAPEDWAPIADVSPRIRYTDKLVTSFKVKLEDGTVIEVTGRIVKQPKGKQS